jgi:DNA-binding response OmpR family regulator
MDKGKALVIEDEIDLLEQVRYNLEKAGFEVVTAGNGILGLDLAVKHRPEVVILDLLLPGMDGLEVCRRIRADERTTRIPVLMATAKATETDIVVGLEMGADDYLTKPFSTRELIARVKALLRRSRSYETEIPEIIRQGIIEIDLNRHQVKCDGNPVRLTATEYRILHYLIERLGQVVSRDAIARTALDVDGSLLGRAIDVHITALRRKLGKGAEQIQTVRGYGYKFQDGRRKEAFSGQASY